MILEGVTGMSELGIEVATRADAVEERGVGDAFVLRREQHGRVVLDCANCGHRYGPAERDPKLGAVFAERSPSGLSALSEPGLLDARLIARHFYCPSCGLLFAVNVQCAEDPIMLEWSIDSSSLQGVL
jgi:acetone carboxylase gamma subunit